MFGKALHRSLPGGGVVNQFTVVEAAAPGPYWFEAITEYAIAPGCALVVVQDAPLDVQFVHWKVVGACVQLAVSVMLPPTYGFGGLAVTVQTGGAVGGCCHVTETCAGKPTPAAFDAVTL